MRLCDSPAGGGFLPGRTSTAWRRKTAAPRANARRAAGRPFPLGAGDDDVQGLDGAPGLVRLVVGPKHLDGTAPAASFGSVNLYRDVPAFVSCEAAGMKTGVSATM
jgi:hypothetical protein